LDIRETLNRHSKITTIVVICVVVAGLVAIGMELKGDDGKPPSENFFTVDDGQTWFADSATKLPPFDHNGQQAVRCYVFKGKNGKFVGMLEKYSDGTLNMLAHRDPSIPLRDSPPSMVKKPGEKNWQSVGGDEEAMILMHITGPDGSDVDRVMP
jgi:hypothetical protein